MVFTPVLEPTSEIDVLLDPDNPAYGFAIDHWVETPSYVASEKDEPEKACRRLANAATFKQNGTTVAWYRYTVLGFYAFDGCAAFDLLWRQFCSKKTLCSKAIWYTYMHHIDRKIDIDPKLMLWATEVAQPHLANTDPIYLRINTTSLTWARSTNPSTNNIGDEAGLWTVVGSRKQSNKSSTKKVSFTGPAGKDSSQRIRPAQSAPTKSSTSPLSSLGKAANRSQSSTVTPIDKPPPPPIPTPPPPPVIQDPPSAWTPPPFLNEQETDNDTTMSENQQSVHTTDGNVPTNDGTFRLTVRWKPPTDYTRIVANTVDWLTT